MAGLRSSSIAAAEAAPESRHRCLLVSAFVAAFSPTAGRTQRPPPAAGQPWPATPSPRLISFALFQKHLLFVFPFFSLR